MGGVCKTYGSAVMPGKFRFFLLLVAGVAWATSPAFGADEPSVLGGWRHFDTADGLPDDYVRTICPHETGVWVGTNDGVAFFDGRSWKRWNVADGLPARVVTAIAVNHATQDAWIGTWGGGLARLSAGRFDTFNQFNSGLVGDLILDLVVVGEVVVVSTNGGLCLFEPLKDRWTISHGLSRSPPVMLAGVNSTDPELLIGEWNSVPRLFSLTTDGGAVALRAQRATVELDFLSERWPMVGFAADESNAWLLARSSLWHAAGINHGYSQRHRWKDGVEIFPTCVSQLQNGGAVVGTSDGLFVFQPSAANSRAESRDKLASALPHKFITCVANAGEIVWVGTAQGLSRGEYRRMEPSSLPLATTPPDRGSTPSDGRRPGKGGITIGLVGPWTRTIRADSTTPVQSVDHQRSDLLAAQVALDSINASIGPQSGFTMKLQTGSGRYKRYGWVLPDDDFGAFAGRPDVVGLLADVPAGGAIRRAVAWQTQIPVMNTASVPTAAASPVDHPWVFRCWADRPRQMKAFMDHLIDELGFTRMAFVRTPGNAARLHRAWWFRHASDRGIRLYDEYHLESMDWDSLRELQPEVVLSWSDAPTSARIISELRRAGLDAVFVGSSNILQDAFLDRAAPDPGSVMTFVTERTRGSQTDDAFRLQYAQRNHRLGQQQQPGENAFRCRDALRHVAFAIRAAGADRMALRKVLSRMASSLVGEKHYELDHLPGPLTIATLGSGEWTFQQASGRAEAESP